MANELRFIDPAFSCEVVLRGVSKALYEVSDSHFDRLKNIRNLGLIGHFDDTGFHSKHHHLVGLLRIFEKLLMQPEGCGLPRKFLWSFWLRLCFAQTGHAAFAYDAEKAVTLACHIDSGFKQALAQFLAPVVQEAKKHIEGHDNAAKEAVVKAWFDEMIEQNKWKCIHLWISALKFIQTPKLQSVLNGQVYDEASRKPGFDFGISLNILLNPENEWRQTCNRLVKLDYVVRDLSLTGRLGITVDVDRLIASPKEKRDPDWRLIDSLSRYLTETLYTSPTRQTESAIFQRTLADLLIKKKVSLGELFGLDPNNYLTDDGLKRIVIKHRQGRELFDVAIKANWKTWRVDARVDHDKAPLLLERKMEGTKQGQGILTLPSKKNVIAYQSSDPDRLGVLFSMRHKDNSDRPEPANVLDTCVRIIKALYPDFNVSSVHQIIGESLSGRSIQHGLSKAMEHLSKIPLSNEAVLHKAVKYLSKSDNSSTSGNEIILKIAGIEHPLESLERGMPLTLMKAVLTGSEEVRKSLGMSLEEAMHIFWSYTLMWQDRFFSPYPKKTISDLIIRSQELLAEQILNNDPEKESKLELYTFLESLVNPPDDVRVRFTFPNIVILKEDRNPENEYDVVTILGKKGKSVEVWIWGVTTESDLSAKRSSDTQKIQQLRDLLGNRWGGEIRAIQNYIHIHNNQICLEIDGRQERRNGNRS